MCSDRNLRFGAGSAGGGIRVALIGSALIWPFFVDGGFLRVSLQSSQVEEQAPQVEEQDSEVIALKATIEELLWGDVYDPQPDKALELLRETELSIEDEQRYLMYRSIGVCYGLMGYYLDAIEVYKGILEDFKDRPSLLEPGVAIASCYEKAGLQDQAIRVWKELRRKRPGGAWELRELARLCSESGQLEEASSYFEAIGDWSAEAYAAETKSEIAVPARWTYRAEHFMRLGRWKEALVYWKKNPRVESASRFLGVPTAKNVLVDYKKALCLRALDRGPEAIHLLAEVLRLGDIGRGSIECAQLYVEMMFEHGIGETLAGLEPETQMFQVLQGIFAVTEMVEAGDCDGLSSLLLYGEAGVPDAKAELAIKCIVTERVVDLECADQGVMREYLGRNDDLFVCIVLASLGDPSIVPRVQAFISEGSWRVELESRLKLLVKLGTEDAYELLRELGLSQDAMVANCARSLVRRYPEGWPVPSSSNFFFSE